MRLLLVRHGESAANRRDFARMGRMAKGETEAEAGELLCLSHLCHHRSAWWPYRASSTLSPPPASMGGVGYRLHSLTFVLQVAHVACAEALQR
jgi:hypothetical protein